MIQIIYNYSMLYIFFNRRITVLYKTDADYKYISHEVKESVKSLNPLTFNPWFDLFNLNQKIEHFKNYISRKLEKLENKVKAKDIYIWEHGTDLEKSKNRYVKKRAELEHKLSDEYISKSIRLVNVGYKNIQKAFITNGYNRNTNNSSTYNVENGGIKFFKDLLPRTLMSTGVVLILRSIILNFIETENVMLLVLQTALTIIPMILHANIGHKYGGDYFQEKVIVDMRTREEIISLFYSEKREVGVVEYGN